ncbi:MATE family efflux transporter [Pacificibacter marinus]|uniref:MATE family efflux transporter n=1 Tax=Pacificibacter marinus TaxID=658057 RepID=UPI001C06F309|nr:MATE family efflux transporter [Pacificibacter marinus]MBU2867227.1 MATE family efflux transporter [Pacificibacter marinus]
MSQTSNAYLTAPIGVTYAKTAVPIIFIMSMNGLLSVMDAMFLSHYVGPNALAAVTLMFPIFMLIVACSTLVSSGMSSLMARHIGGNEMVKARAVFTGAHGLALLTSACLIVLFVLVGAPLSRLASGGNETLARMGLTYIGITVFLSPLLFVLSVQSDTLRNEGRVGFMAAMSLLVSLANIAFNYVLIAVLNMGVAGSAYGTALAQALALGIIILFRLRGTTDLRLNALLQHRLTSAWSDILALGAPQSLGFIGFALGSASIMAALQWVDAPQYESTVSAYGIITRVMTFAYLIMLGLSLAMQTITGNNYGARLWQRTNASLMFAMVVAFLFCATLQVVLHAYAVQIGQAFVSDPAVVAEVARLLPVMTSAFVLSGPLMMISAHFQAIGDAKRAALLSLSKPYLFAIPLTFILSAGLGEIGIWIASPVTEVLVLVLTLSVLASTARRNGQRWGLFYTVSEDLK